MTNGDALIRPDFLNRRNFLKGAGAGLVATNLFGLRQACGLAASANGLTALAPQSPPFLAKAKQVVIVWLAGGFSHVDTFDPKPKLQKDHGKTVSPPQRPDQTFPLLASTFAFRQHGESGMWVSEIFPHLSAVVDELAVIRSMKTDNGNHVEAALELHTGSPSVPLPSIGAWLSHGLGRFNSNLPAYMVLSKETPYSGTQVYDNSFLPPIHQGVRIVPGREPIPNLKPPIESLSLRQLEQKMLHDANEIHAAARPGDLTLAAATSCFDIAEGMTHAAAEAFDISKETRSTLESYGVPDDDANSLGWSCLVVRRLIERGVRVVELVDSGTMNNWDAHLDMQEHRMRAKPIDKPLTALIQDMRQRGLLDETLMVICTEFGRTPWADFPTTKIGRNHYQHAFTCMLAGAGIKGGTVYGETDEYGINIVADPCHIHDYHATILRLMGIDHTQLTYRYAGRDFRLTDVSGNVVEKVLS